jgi:hypothetical protein
MQHFLLTKLALGRPSTEWLVQRLSIFEHFCAPSVRLQKKRNFTWFLVVHPETPWWFVSRAVKAATNAIVVEQSGMSICAHWPRLIGSLVRPGRLVTTRLDSDDMIHEGFVECVQHFAQESPAEFVIDFPVGYQLRLPDLVCQRVVCAKPTHFLSLVESRVTRKIAYCHSHPEMGRRFPVLQITGEPMWVEVCHGGNVINGLSRDGRRINWRQVRDRFMQAPGQVGDKRGVAGCTLKTVKRVPEL